MKNQPNTLHLILSVLITIACGLIFIVYGYMFFATFTDRPGANGNMYYYYRMDKIVFTLYNLISASLALLTIIRLFILLNREDGIKLKRTFIYFAIFLAILVLSEIYLSTRFVGKGL